MSGHWGAVETDRGTKDTDRQGNWAKATTPYLSRANLMGLFTGRIGAVVVPGFVNQADQAKALESIVGHELWSYYRRVEPKVGRLGITQVEHQQNAAEKADYFAKAPQAHRVREEMLRGSGDFLYKVMHFVQYAWGKSVGIAAEPPGRDLYFAGVVRSIGLAKTHVDWARFDAPGWMIGEKVDAQLAWNIYLQMSGDGGDTVVYRRMWQPEDEAFKVAGSYHYDKKVVEGCDFVRVQPNPGDLVLFNSRCFHEVEKSTGQDERITISSFIGLIEETDDLVFWS
jgi:hypothetical protein